WMEMIPEGNTTERANSDQGESPAGQGNVINEIMPILQPREIDFMRREADLLRRELELARRENEMLRNSPQLVSDTRDRPNISIKAIGDLLSDFDGTAHTFPIWETQVRLLRTTYNLDDDTSKILVGTKLRGRALQWLHSKAEHIQ
ncbi:hypothetical protein KPH14_013028, partial [Odynerus spinipes]